MPNLAVFPKFELFKNEVEKFTKSAFTGAVVFEKAYQVHDGAALVFTVTTVRAQIYLVVDCLMQVKLSMVLPGATVALGKNDYLNCTLTLSDADHAEISNIGFIKAVSKVSVLVASTLPAP